MLQAVRNSFAAFVSPKVKTWTTSSEDTVLRGVTCPDITTRAPSAIAAKLVIFHATYVASTDMTSQEI
jgi:hypothetical protein